MTKLPNIVFIFPVFYLKGFEKEEFILDGLSWALEFKEFLHGTESNESSQNYLKILSEKAASLKENNIIFAEKFITTREGDRWLFPGSITKGGVETRNILLVAGERFDEKLVEQKKVTIH